MKISRNSVPLPYKYCVNTVAAFTCKKRNNVTFIEFRPSQSHRVCQSLDSSSESFSPIFLAVHFDSFLSTLQYTLKTAIPSVRLVALSMVIVPRTSDTIRLSSTRGIPKGTREMPLSSRRRCCGTFRPNLFIAHLLRPMEAPGSNCSFEIFPVLRFKYLRRV